MSSNQETKEMLSKPKRRILPTVIIATGVVAGASLYLMGRVDGFKQGAIKGHAVGYKEAVCEVGSILKEFADYNKLKNNVDDI